MLNREPSFATLNRPISFEKPEPYEKAKTKLGLSRGVTDFAANAQSSYAGGERPLELFTNLKLIELQSSNEILLLYLFSLLQNAKERILQGVVDFYSCLLKFGERHFLLCQVQNVFTGVVFLLGKAAGFQKHIPAERFHPL